MSSDARDESRPIISRVDEADSDIDEEEESEHRARVASISLGSSSSYEVIKSATRRGSSISYRYVRRARLVHTIDIFVI